MQVIEQYNFKLIPSERVSEERYQVVKNYIEKVCQNTQVTGKNLNVAEFTSGIFLRDKKLLTVHLNEGKASFGVFDSSTKTLSLTCNIEDFTGLTENDCNTFLLRCSSQMERIANGQYFNISPSLEEAWKKVLSKDENIEINYINVKRKGG